MNQETDRVRTGRSGRTAGWPTSRITRRRLGTTAALGLTAVLTAAIGGTAGTALWISANGLRAQAEDAGRRAAVTAATSFATLAEPSAANIARTLDIVLHDHLQAQAAATALLVETAESAGHGARYIEDALRQIAWRSPIRRIDVTAAAGTGYSTENVPLTVSALEPAFAPLAATPATGRTAAAGATETPETPAGLIKAAAAQPLHRPAAVRIEQLLDSLSAARAYGGADDGTARDLTGQQAAAIARLITHAVELAEDAGWTAGRIEDRLDALVRNTAVEHVAAATADGTVVYEAGETTGVRGEGTVSLETGADGAVALEGSYDAHRRWLTRAAAARGNGRLTATVDIATRTGEGTLVESAWQTEANRLAAVEGVTGVWIAEVTTPADGRAGTTRLAAAAPGPGQAATAQTDAWNRWDRPRSRIAERAAVLSAATATSTIELLSGADATLLSAAPIGRTDGPRAVAVVIESRADEIVSRMRREAATGLAAAAGLIAVLAVMTTWGARRWLTRPVEAMADAARHLQAGERPPAGTTARLQLRRDEIGALARNFDLMTEQVLARHEELTALVADKTRWLQETNAKLTETQQRIASEIGLAKTVQEALVPQGTRTAGNLTLCSRMTPARELGGDFINIDHRPGGDGQTERLFVAVCDVSGKGVAAALFMAVAQSAIAAAAGRHDDVRAITGEANRTLAAQNPLGMFVTGVIALIDTATGRMDYVIAGHEPPLAVRPGEPLRRLVRADNIPLGLDAGEQYHRFEHEMAPGETVAAYTDGITDTCNAEDELFGEPRLQELLTGNSDEAPERMLQQLWTAVDLFSGRTAAADDKTCALVRRHA